MSTHNENPDAFRGAAYYYSRFRPSIPVEVVDYVRDRFKLDGTSVLLDMGCGTGISTFAFAPCFARAVAFDTNDEMLAQARARQPESLRIEWQSRSDRDVTPSEGPYRLATACRSFNWMDQYPLLAKLHHILEPGGGVALIGDGSFWTGDDPWEATVRDVIQRFLGQTRRAGKKTYAAPTEPYTAMLEKSGYLDVEYKDVQVERAWNVDGIIGYLYSTSFSARDLYGDCLGQFEETLRGELLKHNGGEDRFVENVHFVIQSGMQG